MNMYVVHLFVDNLCRAQVAALFTVVPAAAAASAAAPSASVSAPFVCYS